MKTATVQPVPPPPVTSLGPPKSAPVSIPLLGAAGRRILLDCGLVRGRRSEERVRNSDFPFDPASIDAVVLSHAHVDHCGNLPNLVRRGFAGPIYCTPATRALAAVMLGDAAKIQVEDANYLNQRRGEGGAEGEAPYDGQDGVRPPPPPPAGRDG